MNDQIQKYDPARAGKQTGLLRGEPNDVYHSSDAVSSSNLSQFWANPKRYQALMLGEVEPSYTDAMRLGDLFHVTTLEDDETWQDRLVPAEWQPPKPSKAERAAYFRHASATSLSKKEAEAQGARKQKIEIFDAFCKNHAGKTVVSDDEIATADAMRNSLDQDPDAGPLLFAVNAETELTVRTRTLAYGFPVQARIDLCDFENRRMIDLKSVRDLDLFARNVGQLGYYRQAAFYQLVFEKVTGIKINDFLFVACETSPPHECAVFRVDPEDIERGIREIDAGLRSLAKSLESGDFPKRYPGINDVSLKPWDRYNSDRKLEVASNVG